jgi:hypothetical protein
LYEQLPPLHVVSHVPPAHVQSFPEHVSCWFEELHAATMATRKSNVRIMDDPVPAKCRGVTKFGGGCRFFLCGQLR